MTFDGKIIQRWVRKDIRRFGIWRSRSVLSQQLRSQQASHKVYVSRPRPLPLPTRIHTHILVAFNWTEGRKLVAKTNGKSNLGFEAKLWQAADALHNNRDPAEYEYIP